MSEVLLFLALFSALILIAVAGIKTGLEGVDKLLKQNQPPVPEVKIDMSGIETRLTNKLTGLPNTIVNSITGSANTHKGKLGELVGYISMKAEYDRIIPLGTIVDFMAIKFPEGENEGYVHFIDIKTGKHSRLTTDQRKLKALLTKQTIGFKTIRIDEIETD